MVTASVLDGKRPPSKGVFKPGTAYDAGASDVQECCRLVYNRCADEIEREPTNPPETRSIRGGVKYPWSSHGRLGTQRYEREIAGIAATFEKPRFPNTSRHSITWVALSRCDESNITEPAKSIVPFMCAAWASCVERALLTRPAASTANIVFVRFFMGSYVGLVFP